jgi:hypothetical protein
VLSNIWLGRSIAEALAHWTRIPFEAATLGPYVGIGVHPLLGCPVRAPGMAPMLNIGPSAAISLPHDERLLPLIAVRKAASPFSASPRQKPSRSFALHYRRPIEPARFSKAGWCHGAGDPRTGSGRIICAASIL